MSDITELPDMGKWFRALLDAFDALKAQAKELEEFRDTASKHMSFWVNLHQKQTARIAELEVLLKPFAFREPFQLNLENGENSVMAIAVFGDEQASARAALKGEKG
jgi:hypothetical protein